MEVMLFDTESFLEVMGELQEAYNKKNDDGSDCIKVISQSTSEYMEEIHEIFHKIKPFLDEGYSWNKSFQRAGLLKKNVSWRHNAWSRDAVEYAKTQGYGG